MQGPRFNPLVREVYLTCYNYTPQLKILCATSKLGYSQIKYIYIYIYISMKILSLTEVLCCKIITNN